MKLLDKIKEFLKEYEISKKNFYPQVRNKRCYYSKGCYEENGIFQVDIYNMVKNYFKQQKKNMKR
jgi:hypothetical protein